MFRCFVQTNKDTIVLSSVSGNTIIQVDVEVKFIRIVTGVTPSKGVKVKRPSISGGKVWGQGAKTSYRIVIKFRIGVGVPDFITHAKFSSEVLETAGVKFPRLLLISIDFVVVLKPLTVAIQAHISPLTYYKIGLRLSVSLSVCEQCHGRIS